jgi:ABC-type sugar transport system ATPase subunit
MRGTSIQIAGAAQRFPAGIGRPVRLGIRAEAVRLAAPGPGTLPAIVSLTELSGPDQILYVRAQGGIELCCRTDPATAVRVGETVAVEFVAALLHVFEPQTGATLAKAGA